MMCITTIMPYVNCQYVQCLHLYVALADKASFKKMNIFLNEYSGLKKKNNICFEYTDDMH